MTEWPSIHHSNGRDRQVSIPWKAHGIAVTVDGRFGNGTRNAVIAFQKSRRLTPDGVVGRGTWMNLVS
ncbi:hypothetical protein GTY54_24895 [Streptomyces sp. SID625]|nr:hypothetical protein [Streptomyces sp. SID625]